MERAKYVILGAGVAGAATAYGLARRGERDIIIIEREAIVGAHASGRNAALIRRNLKTRADCELSLVAARWLRRPPAEFPRDTDWRATGSLMLFRNNERPRVDGEFTIQRRAGLEFEELTNEETLQFQPLLDGRSFDAAQWTPGDGQINIINLLHGYLEYAAARGARIITNTKADSFIIENGRCSGIATNRGEFRGEWIINAAGGWANSLLQNAAPPLPMTPCRRTMLVTENIGADPAHPFTWDDGKGFYFREDHGGLLWSPCDETPSENCNESVDPAAVARAKSLAKELIPKAANAKINFQWGCLRTLTIDREMCIGPDSALPGLFWVAGLGGHGVTHSPLVADIAADLLIYQKTAVLDGGSVAPRREQRRA